MFTRYPLGKCRVAASLCVVVAPVTLSAGCGTDSCWNLEKGHTYAFQIKEPRPRLAQPPASDTCDGSLGPKLDDLLKFRVIDERQAPGAADCNEAFGVVEGEHGLNIVDGPLLPGGGVPIGAASGQRIIRASTFIDWNGCRGTWGVVVLGNSDEKDAFVEYRPENPVVVLYRAFTPDSTFLSEHPELAGRCAACADHFGVQVTK